MPNAVALIFVFMAMGSFFIIVAAGFEYRRQEAATGSELPRHVLGVPVPRWLTWWALLVGAFLVATLTWASTHLPGTPEVDGARYFFDDHGYQIPTTAMGYQDGLRRQLQLLAGVPGLFHLTAIVTVSRLCITPSRRADKGERARGTRSRYGPKQVARRRG